MKYGDFSSLVQLGVGLHVGTAILQIYGELGVARLERIIKRTRGLFSVPPNERPSQSIEAELELLEGDYEIFSIELFQEYRKYVVINSIVAGILAAILVIIAYKADDPISPDWIWTTIVMVGLSLLPAPITLGVLWFDAGRQVEPMTRRADDLERRALGQGTAGTRPAR